MSVPMIPGRPKPRPNPADDIKNRVNNDLKKRINDGEPDDDDDRIRDDKIILDGMKIEDCMKPERAEIKEKLCNRKYNVNLADPLR